MVERNRVTPTGAIEALELRGTFMGNRGCLHRGHDVVRPWQVRRWITCLLSFRGRHHPQWADGRYTTLFFTDEAVALAAGHRPCAECRRDRYRAFQDAWVAGLGDARPSANAMDRRLHADRLDGIAQRTHRADWTSLPRGAFATLDDTPAVVLEDGVFPWTPSGYGIRQPRPRAGRATVLTPACTVDVLRAGYRPDLAASVG